MTSQAYLFVMIGLCVLGAAYQTQTGWLYLMGATSLGLVLLAWGAAWANMRGVRLRALPVVAAYQGGGAQLEVIAERDVAGRALSLQVLVPPRPPRRFFGLWRGSLVPPDWLNRSVSVVTRSMRGQVSVPLSTEKRGEFPLPLLYVQSAFPLGLVAVARPARLPGAYLVYPIGPHLSDVPWLSPTSLDAGFRLRYDAGHGLMLRGVREYRSGDAWRQLHWRTTARLGKPHVKETEREQGATLVLWLDLRKDVHTADTLEHLITVAVSLLDFAKAAGRPTMLMTQTEAEPSVDGPAAMHELTWLAKAAAIAPIGAAPIGPVGAVLLSPAYVAGWQHWAAHFVYCPGAGANPMDATAYCAVGMDIPDAMRSERGL